MDLGKMKHDRANLVSVQVRDDPRMPKPEPKSKLVSNRGKFERVYEPLHAGAKRDELFDHVRAFGGFRRDECGSWGGY